MFHHTDILSFGDYVDYSGKHKMSESTHYMDIEIIDPTLPPKILTVTVPVAMAPSFLRLIPQAL